MKKVNNNNNNKFRNNTIHSLNYKFDSVSSAGKISGTALDLIKKYNELAKEAHSNGDYVAMEVFRQYAEHYRKIVTEINERKIQTKENQNVSTESSKETTTYNNEQSESTLSNDELIETESVSSNKTENQEDTNKVDTEKNTRKKKSFTIIEVSASSEDTEKTEEKPCQRKNVRKKIPKNTENTSSDN